MSYLKAGLENWQLHTQTEVVSMTPWMHIEVFLTFSKFLRALALLRLACMENLWEQGITLLRAPHRLMPLPVLLTQNSLAECSLRKVGKSIFYHHVTCTAKVR